MKQIGVIGSSHCDEKLYSIAYNVGRLIAERGWILINGGLWGVMEASAKGAKENGGIVVGILPGGKGNVNPYIDIKIATNMYHARNMIIVYSADALIAIGGEYGTISEMAIALKENKTVVAIEPNVVLDGLRIAKSAEEAIDIIENIG
ncbi:TIGR00725 family protein [Archaeoglobales archaeon]|nr:MAG: TIGR00725 family protein [Archaeoglobales archaeon]